MPRSLDFSSNVINYVPEDKNKRVVKTPYGRGIVIRTRRKDNTLGQKSISMYEIELVNGTGSELEKLVDVSNLTSSSHRMLYTPIDYPSVLPIVGSHVLTLWGRGKVVGIKNKETETYVVKLSSWRLARRSSVFCYVCAKECKVIQTRRLFDMDVFEKVEHANDLKQQATEKFKKMDYHGASELYAKALDAVRYVQHGVDSTNELRADLIVIMITCSNNAALCLSKKGDWERVAKFGGNALILIEALEEKGSESKIKKILNGDDFPDSQLFGSWKVKSLLLIAKTHMEKHDETQMMKTLKKALTIVSRYKKENDRMYKQLTSQEKDIRKIRAEFSKKAKMTLQKEKQRARAMFSRTSNETKNQRKVETSTAPDINPVPTSSNIDCSRSATQCFLKSSLQTLAEPKIKPKKQVVPIFDEDFSSKMKPNVGESKKIIATETEVKDVSTLTASNEGEEDDENSEHAFIEEHSEALLILSALAVGWLLVNMAVKRK